MEATATWGPPGRAVSTPSQPAAFPHSSPAHLHPGGQLEVQRAWAGSQPHDGGRFSPPALAWWPPCAGSSSGSVSCLGHGAPLGPASLTETQGLLAGQEVGRHWSRLWGLGWGCPEGRCLPHPARRGWGGVRASLSPSPLLLPGVRDAADDGAEHECGDEGEQCQVDETLDAVIAEAGQGLHVVLSPVGTGRGGTAG